MDSDLKRQEEAKRERCWDARERWAALMAAIRFADAQQPVSRNSKEKCLELQAKKLAGKN
ncbi:hypothetical protein [Aeoliella sp. SH292]|uniref:hypothetical protein n=1 Tax=Aeoliella sp. SH292 TaxID=3454464 RepID=UPI003F9BD83B